MIGIGWKLMYTTVKKWSQLQLLMVFNPCAVFILGCVLMVFGVFLDPRQQNVIL